MEPARHRRPAEPYTFGTFWELHRPCCWLVWLTIARAASPTYCCRARPLYILYSWVDRATLHTRSAFALRVPKKTCGATHFVVRCTCASFVRHLHARALVQSSVRSTTRAAHNRSQLGPRQAAARASAAMPEAAAAGGGKAATLARAVAQEAALSLAVQKFSRGGQARRPQLGGARARLTACTGGNRRHQGQEAQGSAEGVRAPRAQCHDQRRQGELSTPRMPAAAATACAHPTHAAQTEQWLLPAEAGFLEAEGMERTYRFSQEALASSADATSARKAFDLSLPELGPYCLDYTPNGRHVLLGGRKGHLAVVDWAKPRLTTEIQVRCCSCAATAAAARLTGRAAASLARRCARRYAPSSSCTTPTSLLRPKTSALLVPARSSMPVDVAHSRAPSAGMCTSTTSAAWRCTASVSTST